MHRAGIDARDTGLPNKNLNELEGSSYSPFELLLPLHNMVDASIIPRTQLDVRTNAQVQLTALCLVVVAGASREIQNLQSRSFSSGSPGILVGLSESCSRVSQSRFFGQHHTWNSVEGHMFRCSGPSGDREQINAGKFVFRVSPKWCETAENYASSRLAEIHSGWSLCPYSLT